MKFCPRNNEGQSNAFYESIGNLERVSPVLQLVDFEEDDEIIIELISPDYE